MFAERRVPRQFRPRSALRSGHGASADGIDRPLVAGSVSEAEHGKENKVCECPICMVVNTHLEHDDKCPSSCVENEVPEKYP